MKNKNFFIKVLILLICFFNIKSFSSEQFNFDVTEIEVLDNGNTIKGLKRGTIRTNDGNIIDADNFKFDKIKNILNASGNVKVHDTIKDYVIYAEDITYFKNEEIIITTNKSIAKDNKGKIITADKFKFDKINNVLNASGDVKIHDTIKDYIIYAKDITYLTNIEKIITKGKTKSIIQSKYEINSENVIFFLKEGYLRSQKKTIVKDSNSRVYHLDKFDYSINKEQLKGEKVLLITNYNLPNSDKIYFDNAIFNLKKKFFIGKDTKIKLHKDIFNNSKNDPRLEGLSSVGKNNLTVVNKGVFTSCKENDKCPSWSIKAKKITHDKKKKQLIYDNAILKIYDVPVLYFPKFFHPDPTVKRQSGFLKPQINNSNVLGNSLNIPYYKVISDNKDYTFAPTIFDSEVKMFQNEYRQKNKHSSFVANFAYTNGYKSSSTSEKNSISHLFSKLNIDLKLEDFINSELFLSIEKVTNDTYLKIFDTHIKNTNLKPKNFDILNNELKLTLNHQNFNFESGFQTFENLKENSSDRYQYILPYYDFDRILFPEFIDGTVNISSNGSNNLNNTNNLRTTIINDFNYESLDYITSMGFKNKFIIDIKNLNSLGKNDSEYKSSPQLELMSTLKFDTSLPLQKEDLNYTKYITPKLSLKLNPSDMKNYADSERRINVENIFGSNRLGISDSLETGKSLTLGFDYKKEKLEDINKYFELKLASVFRDKEENNIPKSSTINKKNSNLFGSMSNNFSEYINLQYNFAIDNNFETFEYNDFNTTLSVNNFVTQFKFIEENGEMGNINTLENKTSYNFDDKNFITFNTRRNRKINLTEYYDLIYEYKNDCLTAGIKYRKNYYEDRDLKPSENLFFSITLYPLTTYEQKIDQ